MNGPVVLIDWPPGTGATSYDASALFDQKRNAAGLNRGV